jgi:hypothetical protein
VRGIFRTRIYKLYQEAGILRIAVAISQSDQAGAVADLAMGLAAYETLLKGLGVGIYISQPVTGGTNLFLGKRGVDFSFSIA